MDADVVSGLLQLVTPERLLAGEVPRLKDRASKRPATASGCGGARNAAHTLFQQPASFRTPRGMLHREQVFVRSPVFEDRSLLGEVAVDHGERASDFQGDRAIRGVWALVEARRPVPRC